MKTGSPCFVCAAVVVAGENVFETDLPCEMDLACETDFLPEEPGGIIANSGVCGDGMPAGMELGSAAGMDVGRIEGVRTSVGFEAGQIGSAMLVSASILAPSHGDEIARAG